MRKIISTILTAIILGTTLMSLPAAAAPTPSSSEGLNELELSSEKQHQEFKNIKFNVKEILTLDKKEQPQAYFKDESPILSFVLSIIDYATTIIGSLAIIVLIIGGFMLMIAQGDSTKIDEAKEVIKYAAIGLAITFLSYLLAIFIQSLFITAELTPEAAPAAATTEAPAAGTLGESSKVPEQQME